MQKKIPITLKGELIRIEEPQRIERGDIPPLFKMIIGLKTPDEQVAFLELRNKRIGPFVDSDFKIGEIVEVDMTFQGSVKGDKMYNNLYTHEVRRAA